MPYGGRDGAPPFIIPPVNDSALPTVGYQGGPGANGEVAVQRYWNGAARPVSIETFPQLIEAVVSGAVDFGVVPVWNSTIGEIPEACQALRARRAEVVEVAQLTIPVRHFLLGLPGTTLERVRAVATHRVAFTQCTGFLAAHPDIQQVIAWDTGGAAQELAELGGLPLTDVPPSTREPWYAGLPYAPDELSVIANPAAGQRFGLAVLAEDLQDNVLNATRFMVIRGLGIGAATPTAATPPPG